jgi:hypothetical protein
MEQKVDVLFIGPNTEHEQIAPVAKDFDYSFANIADIDSLLESKLDPLLLVISEFDEMSIEELVQISHQQFPDAFLMLFVSKGLSKEKAQVVAKFGADVVLLKNELGHAKVGFSISQILRANYVGFKTVDLTADHPVPFMVYHLMPQRKKFLPLMKEGDLLDGKRLENLKRSPEFYFRRQDAVLYKKYIDDTADKSPGGLAKRCRANFTALQAEFTKLAWELSSQSTKVSYGDGQNLLKKCLDLCKDLLTNLSGFPQAWEIINNSSVGEFGSLERAPAVAAYCGMFSLLMSQDKIEDMMLISLLLDIAMLALPERIAKQLREGTASSREDLAELKLVPGRSLDMVLARKLSISEKQRSMLMAVYENADGSGYPSGFNHEKLTTESQTIRLAKEFDRITLFKLGQAKVDPQTAVQRILETPELAKIFSVEFKTSLRKSHSL